VSPRGNGTAPERDTRRSGQLPVVRPVSGDGPFSQLVRVLKKRVKDVFADLGKRSERFRRVYRAALKRKRGRNYRSHHRGNEVVENMVIFESFQARSYSCSPKALYRAMREDPRFDGFTLIWAFKRPEEYLDHPDMAGCELVYYASQEYYRAYAQAKYWVSNSRLPEQIEPKPEQVYVQTWHGTPFKRIGFDMTTTQNALHSTRELLNMYGREGERFTMLLSPSEFASEKFISAFNLDALDRTDVVVEEGYPRNDFLHTFTPDDVDRVRRELDLPAGKKVILYAPTWRDNQHVTGVGYTYDVQADFDRLRDDLGDEYVVLFRAHYFVTNEFDFARQQGFVRDVSGIDDINELYIVSDILVTDYSSVFFDYANLGRPIVFYMYDLEEYAGELRGFYLDLDELPGRVARTEHELVEAIGDAFLPEPALIKRYEDFRARFTYLDDGHASDRVIERMLVEGALRPLPGGVQAS
jgi:CDP-glycerol glycerophosphotransferase